MKRRDFFVSIAGFLGAFYSSKSKAVEQNTQALVESFGKKNSIQNNVLKASASGKYHLPVNPKKGLEIKVLVDNKCLEAPAKIIHDGVRIAKDREDFILDLPGELILRYEGQMRGWSFV